MKNRKHIPIIVAEDGLYLELDRGATSDDGERVLGVYRPGEIVDASFPVDSSQDDVMGWHDVGDGQGVLGHGGWDPRVRSHGERGVFAQDNMTTLGPANIDPVAVDEQAVVDSWDAQAARVERTLCERFTPPTWSGARVTVVVDKTSSDPEGAPLHIVVPRLLVDSFASSLEELSTEPRRRLFVCGQR